MGFFEEHTPAFLAAVMIVGAIGGALERRVSNWFGVRNMRERIKRLERTPRG